MAIFVYPTLKRYAAYLCEEDPLIEAIRQLLQQ
jgi:hypothetical protein